MSLVGKILFELAQRRDFLSLGQILNRVPQLCRRTFMIIIIHIAYYIHEMPHIFSNVLIEKETMITDAKDSDLMSFIFKMKQQHNSIIFLG